MGREIRRVPPNWEHPKDENGQYKPLSKNRKSKKHTWFQVYETTSEGTPVTPAFETEQELIEHLIQYGESLNPYNSGPINKESAENFVLRTQWAPSLTIKNGEIFSGINGLIA